MKKLAILLCMALGITSTAYASITKNQNLIKEIKTDINKDGKEDTVNVTAQNDNDSSYYKNFTITVTNGANKKVSSYSTANQPDFLINSPKITVNDFKGDGLKEVFISGKSGNYAFATLIDFSTSTPVDLLKNETFSFDVTGKLADNFVANMQIDNTKDKFVIPVSALSNDFINNNIYNKSGKLLVPTDVTVENAGDLEVALNNKGYYSIESSQYIYGTARADGLGNIVTKYTLSNAKWTPEDIKLVSYIVK